MGSFLEKPITEKEVSYEEGELEGEKLSYGMAAMQGWRISMEDRHIHRFGLGDGLSDIGLFLVLDGHGGVEVADFASKAFENELRSSPSFQESRTATGRAKAELVGKGLRESFLSVDSKMKADHRFHQSGSTAVGMVVLKSHYIAANCGDSRVILVGDQGKVLFGSMDHKPTNEEEERRITNAGGTVSFRRVNGDLAVSRALGDFTYKQRDDLDAVQQQVSPEPDITVLDRKATDQFILLACDGIWDVMSNEEAAEFIVQKMNAGFPIDFICEWLITECLNRGSRDNMSVIIVRLPGAPASTGTMSKEDLDNHRKQIMASEGEETDSS